MFTGIVEEVGRVSSLESGHLIVAARKVTQGMSLGDSIAVNGVCLTVTRFDTGSFTVDVMPETLRRSNLGRLSAGSGVNLERPLALGGRLGGHLVQGHVDGTGYVISLAPAKGAVLVSFGAPAEIMRYIVEKGFIAVDGVSLTVTDRDPHSFAVSIVDYTWHNTNLGRRRAGEPVNLEIDIIAKYVEQLQQAKGTGITDAFLQEHGFLVS
ncbi:MAG: riboflavin synthase [Chloroflexi bacterium]|nr:riboflavin synthase [Chloroflexota bacterium]